MTVLRAAVLATVPLLGAPALGAQQFLLPEDLSPDQ